MRVVGIDLCYTGDPVDRIRRAQSAIKIGKWMLLEQLKNALLKNKEK